MRVRPKAGPSRFVAPLRATLGGATIDAVQEATGLRREGAALILRRFHAAGLIHIAGYALSDDGHWLYEVWQLGDGDDAPRPPRPAPRPPRKLPRCSGFYAFAAIMRALQETPRSLAELVELSGCGLESVRVLLHTCRSFGLAHIAAWETPGEIGGGSTRLWAFAIDQPDARPPRIDPRERRARRHAISRERMKHLRTVHALTATLPDFMAAARRF